MRGWGEKGWDTEEYWSGTEDEDDLQTDGHTDGHTDRQTDSRTISFQLKDWVEIIGDEPVPCALALVASRLPNSRIHRYDIMGTRCSGCKWTGDLSLPFHGLSGRTSHRLRVGSGGCGGRVRVGVLLRVPVRRCASSESDRSPRCSDAVLGARRRGSVALSFCLNWRSEGPVFIKGGGSSPK